jgi:hypothetical protein
MKMKTHSHSTNGHEWARLSVLKAGDKIRTDDGFTCGINNKTLEVFADERGAFVRCDEGRHYLDGQADDGDHLIGMWPA